MKTPFEALESRVLLSTTPSGLDPSVWTLPPPITSVILAEPYFSVLPPSLVGEVGQIAAAAPLEPEGLGAGGSTTSGLLLDLVTHHVALQMTPIADFITITNLTTGDVGQGGVAPIVIQVGGGTSPVLTGTNERSGWGYGWNGLTPPSAAGSGGGGTLADGSPPAPTKPPMDAGSLGAPAWTSTRVPDAGHVVLDSSFDATNDEMMVQIPIGPMTHELGLSVRGQSASDPAMGPVLGQMSLVDRDGNTLERFGPLWNSQSGSLPAAVTLALENVPAGGALLVQVATTSGVVPGTASSSANPVLSPGWTLPFVMDVQRQESAASAATGGTTTFVGSLTSSDPAWIGSLAGLSQTTRLLAGSGPAGDPVASNPVPASISDRGDVAQTAEAPTSDEPLVETDAGRIATGPLAARTAAPMGPNLSNVMGDPAPAVDRHERALSQEIASEEAEPGRDWVNPLHGSDAAPDRPIDREGPEDASPSRGAIASIAGLGPWRLKVAGSTRGDHPDELAVLATVLRSAFPPEEGPAVGLDADPADDRLSVTLAAPPKGGPEHHPPPDYLTSACFLALSMGLVTGPIIPDLLRLIPSQRRRRSFLRLGPADPLRGATPVPHRFGFWGRRRPFS